MTKEQAMQALIDRFQDRIPAWRLADEDVEIGLEAVLKAPEAWRVLMGPDVPLVLDKGGDVWAQLSHDGRWLCLGPHGNGLPIPYQALQEQSGVEHAL